MDGWMDGWMNTPSGLRMPSPTLHLITYEKLTVLLCIPLIQKLIVEYKKKEFNGSNIRIRLFHLSGPLHMLVLMPGTPTLLSSFTQLMPPLP